MCMRLHPAICRFAQLFTLCAADVKCSSVVVTLHTRFDFGKNEVGFVLCNEVNFTVRSMVIAV